MPPKPYSKEEVKKLAELEKLQSQRHLHQAALKQASSLLKKYPNNPEIQAWKAYYMYTCDPKSGKQNAIDAVKTAIRQDMLNSKLWKVSGLLYKEMQDFPSALQSFSTAYKRNSKDTGLLSEVCALEFYERHYEQYRVSASTLFKECPTPWNIMRYVFSLVYSNQIENAVKFLTDYESRWKKADNEDEIIFQSECVIFHALLLMKNQNYEECLEYMAKMNALVLDQVKILELRLECLRQIKHYEDALNTINQLIEFYPDNGRYFLAFEAINGPENLISKYQDLQKLHPKSEYIKVRILELMDVNDPDFVPLLAKHIQPLLIRGAPSIYMTIEEMEPVKIDKALEIVQSTTVPLTSVPMQHLFAAQVYGYRGQTDEAIKEIDEGIKHTATCIDLYQWKARFLLAAGRNEEALATARILAEADPNDRNHNLILVKALFATGRRAEALRYCTLFSVDDAGKSQLFETQFNSMYAKYAISSIRCGDFNSAKILNQGILHHFEDFRKGLFTYMSWASRKPRALYEMIDVVDHLECEIKFARAVQWLFRLTIHDGDVSSVLDTAIWTLRSDKPEALAYAAVIFCMLNKPLQAVKCYRRIVDTPYVFIAKPSVEKLLTDISKLPDVVKEIIAEECPKVVREARSFDEIVSLAKGLAAIKDPKATSVMEKAIEFDMKWKQALQIYLTTIVDGIDHSIAEKLEAKYPQYEFKITVKEEEKPGLPNFD